MKLLFLGSYYKKDLEGYKTSWSTISREDYTYFHGQKRKTISFGCEDIYDYDAYVLDLESFSENDVSVSKNLVEPLERRFMTGALIIVFGAKSLAAYEWLGGLLGLSFVQKMGKEVQLAEGSESFLEKFIERYKKSMQWFCVFKNRLERHGDKGFYVWHNEAFEDGIFAPAVYDNYYEGDFSLKNFSGGAILVNKAQEAIGAEFTSKKGGYFFVFPQVKEKPSFLKDFIESVLPKIDSKYQIKEEKVESVPSWLSACPIPGGKNLENQLEEIGVKINELEGVAKELEDRLSVLENYRGLLWRDSYSLHKAVQNALSLLGVQIAETDRGREDLIAEYENNLLYIEITGTNGAIEVAKGRQLLDWVASAQEPHKVKGILIANPYRLNPVEERPPTKNHRLFVKEVEELAQKHDFTLLLSVDLYRVVEKILEGAKVDVEKIMQSVIKNRGLLRL